MGLRLKFEPSTQPVFGPKFGSRVPHFTVQYNTKASARRVQHRGFRGQNPRQENFNSQFGNPDGRSFFPSWTICIHNNPDGPPFALAQDARINGMSPRWPDATQSERRAEVLDELHSQQPQGDPRSAPTQDARNNGRPQRWRDATQSERCVNCLPDRPGREATAVSTPTVDPSKSQNPTMPISPMKPANYGTYWFTG